MMELSTVDDDSYDERAAQAEKEFNQLLESFDNETENLAAQQAAGMIEGRKMEQSGESVGLFGETDERDSSSNSRLFR